MKTVIQFGILESYLIYISILFFAVFTAFLSQRFLSNSKRSVKSLGWLMLVISYLCFAIPLMYRGSGVDNDSYLDIYNQISSWKSIIGNYQGFPEPLFMLIVYYSAKFADSFQFTYILMGSISLFFIYKSFYRKMDEHNLSFLLFVFGFSIYFYFYGLVRLMIAFSIMTYGLHYLENNKVFKYIVFGVIAGLFHYSAFIIIPVFILINLISRNSRRTNVSSTLILSVILVPLIFLISTQLFIFLFSNFEWFGRYTKYLNVNYSPAILKSVVWVLPLLIILLMYGPILEKKVKHYALHVYMFFALLSFAVLSVFFGIQRLTFYMYPSCFYLYEGFLKVKFPLMDQRAIRFMYLSAFALFGFIWLIVVVLGGENWNPFMIPYQFFID